MQTFKQPLTVVSSFMLGALTIMLFQCDPQSTSAPKQICSSYTSETFGEDLEVFGQSVERYLQMHGTLVKDDMGIKGIMLQPSQMCFLPYDTVKKFLHFLELYSTKSGIPTKDLVLPIYYAIHKYDTANRSGALHTVYMGAAVKRDNDIIPFDARATSNNGNTSEIVSLNTLVSNALTNGVPLNAFLLSVPQDSYLKNQFFSIKQWRTNMASGKILVAQGGGPTAVINQSLAGVVLEARRFRQVERIYGARHGVRGIVDEDFVDLDYERNIEDDLPLRLNRDEGPGVRYTTTENNPLSAAGCAAKYCPKSNTVY